MPLIHLSLSSSFPLFFPFHTHFKLWFRKPKTVIPYLTFLLKRKSADHYLDKTPNLEFKHKSYDCALFMYISFPMCLLTSSNCKLEASVNLDSNNLKAQLIII